MKSPEAVNTLREWIVGNLTDEQAAPTVYPLLLRVCRKEQAKFANSFHLSAEDLATELWLSIKHSKESWTGQVSLEYPLAYVAVLTRRMILRLLSNRSREEIWEIREDDPVAWAEDLPSDPMRDLAEKELRESQQKAMDRLRGHLDKMQVKRTVAKAGNGTRWVDPERRENFKALMTQLGWGIAQTSQELRVSRNVVLNWRNGRTAIPDETMKLLEELQESLRHRPPERGEKKGCQHLLEELMRENDLKNRAEMSRYLVRHTGLGRSTIGRLLTQGICSERTRQRITALLGKKIF
ncbi:hypothetical protein BAE30_08530 [Acidithiobacillus caldus]|uniref:RNA polymerase sigma-70 region 2 domain-containing protein n=1 Tax=Acidithiobacillus caldus TaxID=33059 RepID=A0A1E7YV76_9PROT|nr:hypothetical protein BAE30_08530 [Acidithiobacillus caldus]